MWNSHYDRDNPAADLQAVLHVRAAAPIHDIATSIRAASAIIALDGISRCEYSDR